MDLYPVLFVMHLIISHDFSLSYSDIFLINVVFTRTVVVYDKPEETCNLESFKSCQPVTRLVPHLKDKDKCVGKKLMLDDVKITILS